MTEQFGQESYITPLVRMFGVDDNIITYRPEVARLTGSVTSAILLQQVYHYWKTNAFSSFYKFKSPPKEKHKAYREGDSWCEKLAFGKAEFEAALKRIATKMHKGQSKEAAFKWEFPKPEDFSGDEKGYQSAIAVAITHTVIYWTDGKHVTWFEINAKMLHQVLTLAYGSKSENRIQENPKSENRISLDESENRTSLYTESTHRVNTSLSEVASAPPTDVPKVEQPKRPAINQVLKDAIAIHVQGLSPSEGVEMTGLLANKAAAVWQRKLDKPHLTAEHYASVARSIPEFVSWFRANNNGYSPTAKDPKKFETDYALFVSTNGRSKAQAAESKYIDDPDNPGIKITRLQLENRERNKKLIEAEYGKAS